MDLSKTGLIMVISGPSGAGKTTVITDVMKTIPGMKFSVSATTRPPRYHEADGISYYFISQTDFDELIEKDELLEWAEYAGNRYGTPIAPVLQSIKNGEVIVLDIDVQGALAVKQRCPDAIMVFISPSDPAESERRLRYRNTESEDKILARLEIARKESAYIGEYDYLVINDIFSEAVRCLSSIVIAEQCKIKKNISEATQC